MKEIFNRNRIEYLIVLCCTCSFIGFVCSRAMISIGMIALVVLAFITLNPLEILRRYVLRKELWVLSLFFLLVLFSGFYSEDKQAYAGWLRIKLPFLFLPVAFAAFPVLGKRSVTLILYSFIIIVSLSAMAVLVNYYLHFAEINEGMLRGNAIPMPFSHIRYTLMLAFAFFCSWYLLESKSVVKYANEKYVLIALLAFLFIGLHILSVRSSLVALYLGVALLLVRMVVINKQWKSGLLALVFLVAVPYLAYLLVPSLHNKISYMRYDVNEYLNGNINQNSDAGRLVSWKVGLAIWKQNKLLGAGAGDIRSETEKVYIEQFPQVPKENRKVPHNQFIWVMAGSGVIGLLLFLVAFFIPYLTNGYYKQWLIVLLGIIIFSSFFTEDTFEEQIGTGFYLIFLLVFMNYFGVADE
ncbi:MAG: O-antigen ligase family protein [Chitinophagales bacterium]